MSRNRRATPTYATSWVARQLGVSVATLRTWHHRYGIDPTARTPGGHRRYSGADFGRLQAMHQLIQSGVPAAEAARLSHADCPGVSTSLYRAGDRSRGGRVDAATARRQRRELQEAARALDGPRVDVLLADMLRVSGVVPTWTDILVPVLQNLGESASNSWDCIPAEHVLTERTTAALSAVVARRARTSTGPPFLLAAVDKEQHVLPLHALAAAIAEKRRSSVVLGSVPPVALDAALDTIEPSAVFLWARVRPGRRTALPETRATGATAPRVVVGGPEWTERGVPKGARRCDTLAAAVNALLAES